MSKGRSGGREELVLGVADVTKVRAFIPRGHKHIRVAIETKDLTIVLQEATVAGIVRAYLNVLLHPVKRAVELRLTRVGPGVRKDGYAEYQLLEGDPDEGCSR